MVVEVVTGVDTQVATATYTADDLAACRPACDVDGQIRLRDDAGRTSSTSESRWTSVAALVRETGVDPATLTYVEVLDARGVSHPVDGDHLRPAGSDGWAPAVASAGTSLTYVRPLQGPEDVNQTADPDLNGYFQTSPAQGQTLVVRAHVTGRWLHPTISDRATSRTSHVLTAGLDSPAPSAPAYAWDLGDGAQASGPTASHTWTARTQPYVVRLTVTAPDGSWGRALRAVGVTPSTPPTPPPTGTGTPTPPAPSTPAGPGGSGGTGTGTRSGVRTGPAGGDPRGATSGPSASPGATPASPSPSPSNSPSASATAPPPAGDEVAGTLLDSPAGSSRATASAPLSLPPSASRRAADPPLRLPGWLLVGVLVLALYGGGLVRELRTGRRPRPSQEP